ncbi:MAG TPA: hypothetical protein VE174_14670 [Actinomycetota bacterium]|nr:hypothetical protein [Actinomycetota bacterium]
MTNGLRSFAAMALVIALAAVATSAPVALSQNGNRETFTLTSIDKKEKTAEVDSNGDGDSEDLGDRDAGGGPLFTGKNGKRAGTQRHDCVVTKASQNDVVLTCQGSFTIKGRGTIEASGWIKFTRQGGVRSRLAIVGGTRDFSGATGHIAFGGTNKTTTFEFHVTH